MAVGKVVGHSSGRSAAVMNSEVVLFLDQLQKVRGVVETGVTVKDRLVLPPTVMVSDVPLFITDE